MAHSGEQPRLPEHADSAVIETTFGLNLTIKTDFNSREDFSASLDIQSLEIATRGVQSTSSSNPRHFRIFPGYGTDFIWLNDNDPAYNRESKHIELGDALAGLPKEPVDNYDAWVETYTTSFKKRCDEPGDYSVHVFPTIIGEISWDVAGFLLALRIALAVYVGSVEFAVGREKYVLRKGDGIEDVIYSYLEDQARFFQKGETLL